MQNKLPLHMLPRLLTYYMKIETEKNTDLQKVEPSKLSLYTVLITMNIPLSQYHKEWAYPSRTRET
jgi:hypothetical protein